MLGIGYPDRHALLFTRSLSPENVPTATSTPPARAGSFFVVSPIPVRPGGVG